MKSIKEMSHSEIIELTEQDIERMIDYECAKAGIRFVKCPEKPLEPKFDETPNAFEIARVIVRSRESAEKIQSCLMSCKSDILEAGYMGVDRALRIEEVHWQTRSEREERDKREEEYDELKKAYNEARLAYDEFLSRRQSIEQPIWDKWNEEKARAYQVEHLQSMCQKYFDLAEGNETVALNFLSSAYGPEINQLADIFDPKSFMSLLKLPEAKEETEK